MKISYITLHYISNYGSVLQTYATQAIFERLGLESECVDYVRENCSRTLKKAKACLREIKPNAGVIYRYLFYAYYALSDIKCRMVFDSFVKKYIKLSKKYETYSELISNPPKADVYCTGSDQTWNLEYNGGVLPEYFLGYVPDGGKKISFSASFGMDYIPDGDVETIKRLLSSYKYLSTREKSAAKLMKSLGYDDVKVVLDPTLVLNGDDWRALIKKKIDGKYILVFSLYKNTKLYDVAEQLSAKYDLPIMRVSLSIKDIFKKNTLYIPPVNDWLAWIDGATCVVTDSFHGTAFSVNFEKNFFVVYPEKYSTRLQSLLEMINCEDRVVDSQVDISKPDIDYSRVRKILEKERLNTVSFLKQACECSTEGDKI